MRATGRPSDMGATSQGREEARRVTPPATRSGAPGTDGWVHVRIRSVESLPSLARDGDDHVVIRAHIHLGTLLPADVKVDFLAPASPASRAGDAPEACCQLWSVQSYDNGSFVFEAVVPAELVDGAPRVGVRVGPRRATEEHPALRPVVRWLQPAPANG